jgi:hypothetical protein
VQPLGYASWQSVRPGSLTAIGVISIILGFSAAICNTCGVVGVLASSALSSFATKAFQSAQSQRAATSPPATPRGQAQGRIASPLAPAAASPTTARAYPGAMPSSERDVVVNALANMRALTAAQRGHLDALLARAGHRIFPPGPTPLTVDTVELAIRQSGTTNAATDDDSSGMTDYFVTRAGRIEVSEDDATFRPADDPTAAITVTGTRASRATATPPTYGSAGSRRFVVSTMAPAEKAANVALALANLALAIFLIVIGFMVMYNSPRGGPLHYRYAVLKVILVVIQTTISVVWLNHYTTQLGPSATPPMIVGYVFGVIAVQLLFGCAYPLVIILVLRTRRVREYYAYMQPVAPASAT